MPSLSHEVALEYMLAAKLKPLVKYPGRGTLPWKSRCLQCGQVVTPSLSSVRNNGGGCRPCGLKKSAKTRSADLSIAIDVMRKAGAEPIGEYPGSGKPWLCKCTKCGKEILPRFGNVKKGTAACVYCAGKKIDPEDAKKLMTEYGYKPLVEYPGSNTPWKAIHVQCGELVSPRFTALQTGRGGCMKCGFKSNQAKQLGDPEKARELMLNAKLEPLEPYPGASRPWKCKCLKCGREVLPYYNRVKSGTGCGYCAGKAVEPLEAEVVMRNANLEPLVPYPGARKHWKSKCMRCNRIVSPTYGDVRIGEGGCKYCGKKYVDPDEARALMISKGLIPQVPYPGSSVGWKSLCAKCGKEIFPVYNTVNGRDSGCKYCKGVFVDAADAEKLMRDRNLIPLVPYPGASTPWKCQCMVCGKKISPQYGAIVQGQGSCKYCSRKVVAPEDAVQVMLKNNLEPLEPYSRADEPWKCRCKKCGKTVTPSYVSVNGGQGGCKYCATRGIDYSASAFIYLMTNREKGAHKIGIGTDKTRDNRIHAHKRDGWEVYKSVSIPTAEEAEKIEYQVIKWLRDVKKLPPYLSKKEMKRGGFSETVDASEIDLSTIWAKIEELSKLQPSK
ncbi:MAG: GIY-YIG nuclease family protein [Actinomycetes bacterium]